MRCNAPKSINLKLKGAEMDTLSAYVDIPKCSIEEMEAAEPRRHAIHEKGRNLHCLKPEVHSW